MRAAVRDIGPATTRVGLIGWPVGHSRSPALHNAVHGLLSVDAHYHLLPTPPPALQSTVHALGRLGWAGVNVTIPHKVEALSLCDTLSEEARLIGAVNVLVWREGALHGDNTDALGYTRSLRASTSWDGGGVVTVFGTGGAARAVVVGLAREGAQLRLVGRRADALDTIVAVARTAGGTDVASVLVDDTVAVASAVASSDVIVNATPLGMQGERLPGPMHQLRVDQVASDLVYQPAWTPFLRDARVSGVAVHPGIGMLVHQAALAWACWYGGDAPTAAFQEVADRQ